MVEAKGILHIWGLSQFGLGEWAIISFLLFIVFQDLNQKKILNRSIILVAACSALMWLLVGAGGVPSISSLMASALNSSFERGAVLAVLFSGGPLSLILLFLLGLPLYLFKIIGGGDYKLLLAMSLATPLEMIPDFLIWVLIWNSVLSLMMILTQGVVWKSILFLAPASLARSLALPGTEHRGVGIPFSIGISLGYLSLLQSAVLGFSLVKIF